LVVKFQLLNKLALPAESLGPGERYTIRVTVKAVEAISGLIVQILIRNHMGIPFSTLSTDETAPGALTLARDEMLKDELLTVDFRLTIPEIYAAHFSFSPAVLSAQTGKREVCDWIDNALSIEVAPGKLPIYGFVHIPCRVVSPTPIPTHLVSEEGLL
jgi:hypothetical protein